MNFSGTEVGNALIDDALVRRLITHQFPQWADLPVALVKRCGWDNKIFRLGKYMAVRLPSAAAYAAQIEKEQCWLPRLAPSLPLAIPTPLAVGKPSHGFPWQWSVYRWLDGETATRERIADLCDFAARLAHFLHALQRIDSTDGPCAGRHNFYRGGALATYDGETRRALEILADRMDVDAANEVWQRALATTWLGSPVWVHGDVAPGNLLVNEGRLSSVIDFGTCGVGDPACDLSIAWTLFDGESREVFRKAIALDAETWARGRGWTLWKASIIAAGLVAANSFDADDAPPWRVIDQVLRDHQQEWRASG